MPDCVRKMPIKTVSSEGSRYDTFIMGKYRQENSGFCLCFKDKPAIYLTFLIVEHTGLEPVAFTLPV